MQPLFDLIQPVLQPSPHGYDPIAQPFFQNLFEIFNVRTTIQANHVEIDSITFFQIGGGE